MGYRQVRPAVLAYLTKNTNRPVHVDAIAEATGLTKDQVRGCMAGMIRNGDKGITTVNRATVWVFNPVPEPEPTTDPSAPVDFTGELFECVGHTRTGIILRGPSGSLYRATEME